MRSQTRIAANFEMLEQRVRLRGNETPVRFQPDLSLGAVKRPDNVPAVTFNPKYAFSRSVVSDECSTSFGRASVRPNYQTNI